MTILDAVGHPLAPNEIVVDLTVLDHHQPAVLSAEPGLHTPAQT